MVDMSQEKIRSALLACRRRLAALPIDPKKKPIEVGSSIIPCWHLRQTIRADDSYNIIDCEFSTNAQPETIAMFVPKEEAEFIVNAPADIAMLLHITNYALTIIPALKEKIKQQESEINKLKANSK